MLLQKRPNMWLVGMLEGEGTFGTAIHKEGGRKGKVGNPILKLTTTDKDVAKRVELCLKDSRFYTRTRDEPRKVAYDVQLSGWRAIEIMERIFPYMGNRRQQQIRNVIDLWYKPGQKRKMDDWPEHIFLKWWRMSRERTINE